MKLSRLCSAFYIFRVLVSSAGLFVFPLEGFAKQASSQAGKQSRPANFHSLYADDISGKPVLFSQYKNKVLLVVNTASQCGYTPQYRGLEETYRKYRDKGFLVLGFPSNDFGGQEPGSNAEVKKFCEFKFKVSFPMFSKVNVTSLPRSPVYEFLTAQNPSSATRKVPEWNFWKYLIDRRGNVANVYSSSTEPDSKELTTAIEKLLNTK
ncbi:MAG: glutathione peroxidase [Proteobacteria bacterium]|nr:glutathione peroxidase [Pseudomonadota bacterium]